MTQDKHYRVDKRHRFKGREYSWGGRRRWGCWHGRHHVCIQISCLNLLAHSHQLISPQHYWHRQPMWPEWHGVNIPPHVLRSRAEGAAGYCSTLYLSKGRVAFTFRAASAWRTRFFLIRTQVSYRQHTCYPSSVHTLQPPPPYWQLKGP